MIFNGNLKSTKYCTKSTKELKTTKRKNEPLQGHDNDILVNEVYRLPYISLCIINNNNNHNSSKRFMLVRQRGADQP